MVLAIDDLQFALERFGAHGALNRIQRPLATLLDRFAVHLPHVAVFRRVFHRHRASGRLIDEEVGDDAALLVDASRFVELLNVFGFFCGQVPEGLDVGGVGLEDARDDLIEIGRRRRPPGWRACLIRVERCQRQHGKP